MWRWMILPFKRITDYEGRSRRKEYWWFVLLLFLLQGVVAVGLPLIQDMGTSELVGWVVVFVSLAGFLAAIVATIALSVRRFHDQDKSGWFILVGLLPLVGAFILLVFMLIDGTEGDNRFGPDPKVDDRDVITT